MAKIKGTRKNDDLVGTIGNDNFFGGAGDDKITTVGGNDTVRSGSGNDRINISNGSSADIRAGTGNDVVIVNAGSHGSFIALGAGDDTVKIAESTLSNQTFKIVGGAGTDTIQFAGDIANYTVVRDGNTRIVTDQHHNTYTMSVNDNVSFKGVPYTEPTAPGNHAPTGTASAVLAVGTEDNSYVVSEKSLLKGFSDADGDALSISNLTASGNATVVDNGDGTWTITPAANFHGDVSLGYAVVDGKGGSVAATQHITFNAVDDAPVLAHEIADQAATEGQPFTFTVDANAFTDLDSSSLTYTAKLENGDDLPSWLSFDPTTRSFTGTPGDNDSGSFAIRLTASDGTSSVSDVFSVKVADVPAPSPAPAIVGGVLNLTGDYDYDVVEAKDAGLLVITVDGKTFTYDASQIDSINTHGANSVDINTKGWTPRDIDGDVNFTNVSFTTAGPSGPFESTFELGGVAITGNATVNGSAQDFFRAAWDYIDDHYQYYNEPVNSYAVDVGIKYALYLLAGGEPLTDIVKYTADANSDGIPERSQTMHDNLLGNLTRPGIMDKFGLIASDHDLTPQDILDRIHDAGLDDFLDRAWFGGYQSDTNGPAHNAVRVFDYNHGIDRPDYKFFDSNGTVDAAAINNGEMYYGHGNSPNNFVIGQHEGAGIETALKIHFRTGDDILPTLTTSDGIVNFLVPEGNQQDGVGNATGTNPNRAAWSFDYSIVAGLNGATTGLDDFDFKLKVDTDSSMGVNYQVFNLVDLGNGVTPFVSALGTPGAGFGDDDGNTANIAQNSGNFGFGFLSSVVDNGDGYHFGKGTFDIELVAYRKGSDEILSDTHIRVVVDGDQFHF